MPGPARALEAAEEEHDQPLVLAHDVDDAGQDPEEQDEPHDQDDQAGGIVEVH